MSLKLPLPDLWPVHPCMVTPSVLGQLWPAKAVPLWGHSQPHSLGIVAPRTGAPCPPADTQPSATHSSLCSLQKTTLA